MSKNVEPTTARNAEQSQSPPCSPPAAYLASIATIAMSLNEAAQALLAFSKTSETEPPVNAEPESSQQCIQFCYDPYERNASSSSRKLAKSIEKEYERGEFNDEIRCFRIPDFIVKLEYNLCCHYKQENLVDLADTVRDDLLSITLLMKHFDASVDISGDDLHLLAGCLSRPLNVLQEVCAQLADYTLVYKTTIPVQ